MVFPKDWPFAHSFPTGVVDAKSPAGQGEKALIHSFHNPYYYVY